MPSLRFHIPSQAINKTRLTQNSQVTTQPTNNNTKTKQNKQKQSRTSKTTKQKRHKSSSSASKSKHKQMGFCDFAKRRVPILC
jgi:hypothetical protein